MSIDTVKVKIAYNPIDIMEYSTKSGALMKFILRKRRDYISVTYDITMEKIITEEFYCRDSEIVNTRVVPALNEKN